MVRVTLPGGAGFDTHGDENLLAAAQRAHWLIRFGCRNGNCGACEATLLVGRVRQRDSVVDAAAGPQPFLPCLAQALTDLQIDLPGDHLHGSVNLARRIYMQLHSATAESTADGGTRWRLVFLLPAGRQPAIYAGQYLRLSTEPMQTAWASAAPLCGRELTVFAARAPSLQPGERVSVVYPLGYAYAYALTTAAPQWLLTDAANRDRVLALQAVWPGSILIDGDTPEWPCCRNPVSIHAYADDGATAAHWYRQLLAAHVPFCELRSDFAVLRPWRVCRQDDNDNRFIMAEFLDEITARAQVDEFTARGHKQLYWAEPMQNLSGQEHGV